MPRVSSIHHINYLVRDLQQAAASFAAQLGLQFGPNEALPSRGVIMRRARIGAIWFVLVQPTSANTPIARRLAELGEGVFLLSFGTDDFDSAKSSGLLLGPERSGLDGWRVADLTELSGPSTVLQLCQDPVLEIARRFCGPDRSANGGYAAGLIAETVAKMTAHDNSESGARQALSVQLRTPPPLDTPLVLTRDASGSYYLHRADSRESRPIASAAWRDFELGPIAPVVSLAAASAAESSSAAFQSVRYAHCFVCGQKREPGDGLRIFPAAPAAGSPNVRNKLDTPNTLVAAVWRPAIALASLPSAAPPSAADEIVADRFIWSALDCPGNFALEGDRESLLLAEFAVQIYERPRLTDTLIVQGWPIGAEGRGLLAGTALYALDGRVLAAGRARWQAPRGPADSAAHPAASQLHDSQRT